MSYGLDYSEVRYETDHAGNRLKATIPYTMFSALTEFWIAARRAQTAALEATARPGQYKGSLQSAQLPNPPTPEAEASTTKHANQHDRHWQTLISILPADTPPPAVQPSPPEAEAITPPAMPIESTKPKRPQRVFYREFVEAPPAEVMERVANGVYFTRAWREYRGLTLKDAAELYGRDVTTIIWHEKGKSSTSQATIEKLAQIYDCPVAQMTPVPGSDISPFGSEPVIKAEPVAAVETKASKKAKAAQVQPQDKPRRTISEPRSPAETFYPETVLAHLHTGKSPMLAWRLHTGMTVKALADAYGTTTSNVTAMEANTWLRPKTIDKLCPILHCKPEQLLRPLGMVSTGEAADESPVPAPVVKPAPREKKVKAPAATPTSVMESAFMQARVEERVPREPKARTRDRNDRLAKMQRELASL